jgi:hypothetical protein
VTRLADVDLGLERTRTEPWPAECPRCGGPPHSPCDDIAPTPTPKEAPVAIKRDLSDLPPAGLAPDDSPRFISVLVDEWADARDDDKPTANGTPFRHSDAGKCARAISYTAAGIPRSDPMDITGVWNTSLGTLIHEQWQEALQRRWPDAEVEVTCSMVGADGSGHIDAVIRDYPSPLRSDAPWVIAYELKTVGGFGFKAAVGAARKGTPAEGPKAAHLLQAAINGRAVDADEVIVGYLAKECISANVARRFGITDDVGPVRRRVDPDPRAVRAAGRSRSRAGGGDLGPGGRRHARRPQVPGDAGGGRGDRPRDRGVGGSTSRRPTTASPTGWRPTPARRGSATTAPINPSARPPRPGASRSRPS